MHDHAFHALSPRPGLTWPRLRRLFEADLVTGRVRPRAARGGLPRRPARAPTTFTMAVPGAVLPVACVSTSPCCPTYRRRGILRSLHAPGSSPTSQHALRSRSRRCGPRRLRCTGGTDTGGRLPPRTSGSAAARARSLRPPRPTRFLSRGHGTYGKRHSGSNDFIFCIPKI